jgi:hypothetical protein
MTELQKDWLTDGLIDFEYKKYILLAYLKDIRLRFDELKLYPFMADLVFHYQNLLKVKESKELIYELFPKTITKADFKKLELSYQKIVKDDEVMQEIEIILSYALPQMKGALSQGKELFEMVESHLEISPIGITPLYANEGYIFLQVDKVFEVNIFRYQVSVFENAHENYRSINTTYIHQEVRSISNTYESIKMRLAKRFAFLPNPASYLVLSKLSFPLPETLLPVAKRMLMKHIQVS